MLAAFWVLSSLTGLCCILNYRIALWLGRINISLFLLISITSYTKIFRTLSHHQAEVQHHVQQQLSQPNALNMVKYRKALYSALLVLFALVVCYIPYFIIETLISQSNTDSLHLVVFWRLTIGLVQFHSTLRSETSCEADNKTSSLLSVELDPSRVSLLSILNCFMMLLDTERLSDLLMQRNIWETGKTSRLTYYGRQFAGKFSHERQRFYPSLSFNIKRVYL